MCPCTGICSPDIFTCCQKKEGPGSNVAERSMTNMRRSTSGQSSCRLSAPNVGDQLGVEQLRSSRDAAKNKFRVICEICVNEIFLNEMCFISVMYVCTRSMDHGVPHGPLGRRPLGSNQHLVDMCGSSDALASSWNLIGFFNMMLKVFTFIPISSSP